MKVSADGRKLGTHTIASDAEILDAAGGNAVKIFPSRLAGMELTSGKVSYYSLNGSGEIDRMVLNNATGDAYHYGVLTHMESLGEGLYASYSYEYDVGGTSYSIPSTSTRYPVQAGPILVDGDPADPDRLLSLTSVKADKISGGKLVSGQPPVPSGRRGHRLRAAGSGLLPVHPGPGPGAWPLPHRLV